MSEKRMVYAEDVIQRLRDLAPEILGGWYNPDMENELEQLVCIAESTPTAADSPHCDGETADGNGQWHDAESDPPQFEKDQYRFSPFAAPWSRKIQQAFPKAYVTMNFELILVPRTNTYINLNHCSTPDEFKVKIIENCSRLASKGYSKPLRKEHLDGINKLLDTNFTQEDMEYIYTYLGNGIKHELCMKFVQSGYDLGVIDEGLQEEVKKP